MGHAKVAQGKDEHEGWKFGFCSPPQKTFSGGIREPTELLRLLLFIQKRLEIKLLYVHIKNKRAASQMFHLWRLNQRHCTAPSNLATRTITS